MVTMEFEDPQRHILRPTLSIDMVHRVLRGERQKTKQNTVVEKDRDHGKEILL